MKRGARNRAARLESTGSKEQPVSEMEREARNRAARQEPTGAKEQPVHFEEVRSNDDKYYGNNAAVCKQCEKTAGKYRSF